MSERATQLDLSQLAVDRSQPAKSGVRLRRPWLTRYVLPVGILAGFAGLFGWAARDSFLPAQSITVTPVVVSRAEIQQGGAPLFQAAGWIEPRPTPVVASSLAPGVIREMLVIEGQHVEEGEPVARLIDTDARLALAERRATHELLKSEVRRAEARLEAARTKLAKPVELRAALAAAEATYNETQLTLSNLPFAIANARTQMELATENVKRKELAGEAVLGRLLREARANLTAAQTTVAELTARVPMLRAQTASLAQRSGALREQLELLTDETREVAEAEADLAGARAKLDQNQARVDAVELQLERMVVRSPIQGCVLSLHARPGQWLSGVGAPATQGSSAVVGLYDPQQLQVRVDVRLEDVPQVLIGQPVQIETAALAAPILGEVISVTTRADIQKNTLQVKVAIADPPAVIKPEMLGKVTFLAPPSPVVEGDQRDAPLRMFVPQSLVTSSGGEASVWIANLTMNIATLVRVEVGRGSTSDGLVEVTSGLQPTDKLIVGGRESVDEGGRVRVVGEDRTKSGSDWNRQTAPRTARASGSNG